MKIYKTPVSMFVIKSQNHSGLFMWSPTEQNMPVQAPSTHNSCLTSYCWLTTDNPPRHQGKSANRPTETSTA